MRNRGLAGWKSAVAVFLAAATMAAAPAWAATLHAILVIDTGDKNIGNMVARDLNIMGDEVQRIAQATGLALDDRVYKGADFTIENVKGAVQGLSPGPDDVVIFYYSGHGFRTPPKKSDWPYFYFHSDRTIDFGWVADTLNAKGARLTLSLVDACNNVVNVQVREEQKGLPANLQAGYDRLFLKFKGVIAGASSIPGETSTATSSGSLFTISFLKALHDEAARANPTWDSLMKAAAGSRLTHQGSNGKVYSQMPFYAMNTSPVAPTPAPTPPPAVTPPTPTVQPPTVSAQPPVPTVRYPTQRPTQPPAANPPAQPPAPASPPAVQPPATPPQGQWVPIN